MYGAITHTVAYLDNIFKLIFSPISQLYAKTLKFYRKWKFLNSVDDAQLRSCDVSIKEHNCRNELKSSLSGGTPNTLKQWKFKT